MDERVLALIAQFGAEVTPKFTVGFEGDPEDQIRGPIENLLRAYSAEVGLPTVATGEARDAETRDRPDYVLHRQRLLVGHIELKAPGKGADVRLYRGHDRSQWDRYRRYPNILYTDGNEWALYRSGERVGGIVRMHGDVRRDGASLGVNPVELTALLSGFLNWQPTPPRTAPALARVCADLCRLLRAEVESALAIGPDTPIARLADEWRALLFPGCSDSQFADYYAQTVTFALLLARSENVDVVDLHAASTSLSGHAHRLLGRALEVLTDDEVRSLVSSSLETLQRVISTVDWGLLRASDTLPGLDTAAAHEGSPWLYFYEDFLAEYDPSLRESMGAYYTPPSLVRAQVALVDDILRRYFGLPLGVASDTAVILDPALGTGSYLLTVLETARNTVRQREGDGAVPNRLRDMRHRLLGFELMVGPYAVAEMQLSGWFARAEVPASESGIRLYLTDTLADPFAEEAHLGGVYEPIAASRRDANAVKREEQVLVCLGNPPYDRHEPDEHTAEWVRHGSPTSEDSPILQNFISGDIQFGHLASLYNLYVYFWRWGLWKVFEAHPDSAGGLVAFVTSSSFLDGPGFTQMRRHMRTISDEIWVLDLGGEGRGALTDDNVFDIQTPVAVTICRRGVPSADGAAPVHYARIFGSRAEKYRQLLSITGLDSIEWTDAANGWTDSFTPPPPSRWLQMPAVIDLFPWRLPGVMASRNWPIAADAESLRMRWSQLLCAPDARRRELFHECALVKTDSNRLPFDGTLPLPKIATLPAGTPPLELRRIAWRSFDRQHILLDPRLLTLARPELWNRLGRGQVFMTTLNQDVFASGPGATFTALVPDKHHFHGRGGTVIPLWLDADSSQPNVAEGLISLLSDTYGREVAAHEPYLYAAGILGGRPYCSHFGAELLFKTGPRLPLTADPSLFTAAVDIGCRVLHLSTYGEFDVAPGAPPSVPQGTARVSGSHPMPTTRPQTYNYDPETHSLAVGSGILTDVPVQVWEYSVSGWPVVRRWLDYRLARPRGRSSSDLDSVHSEAWPAVWTTELLELLWVLEGLTALERPQMDVLESITRGDLISVDLLKAHGVQLGQRDTRTTSRGHSPGQTQLPMVAEEPG